jgi:hypothetical protein
MADTFTTRLTLTKPEVGASTDTWGTKLNANFDTVDGLFDAGPALKVVNGGTGATSAGAARTNLGLGTMATQAADAVAITGGSATLTGALTLSDTQPKMFFYESDAETNEKYWRVLTTEGQFAIQPFDDSLSSGSNAVVIARTGITVDSIAFNATSVAVTGALTVNGDAVSAIPYSSGSFTASLRTVSDVGSVIATGTAYWHKVGDVATLTIPALTATTVETVFWVTGIPADIDPATAHYLSAPVNNGAAVTPGTILVTTTNSLALYTAGGFTSSGSTKGTVQTTLVYRVA